MKGNPNNGCGVMNYLEISQIIFFKSLKYFLLYTDCDQLVCDATVISTALCGFSQLNPLR